MKNGVFSTFVHLIALSGEIGNLSLPLMWLYDVLRVKVVWNVKVICFTFTLTHWFYPKEQRFLFVFFQYPMCQILWQVLGPEVLSRVGLGLVLAVISPLLAYIVDIRHNSNYGAVYGMYAASYNLGLITGRASSICCTLLFLSFMILHIFIISHFCVCVCVWFIDLFV